MPVVRGQFDQLIAPGARKVFVEDYNELPAHYPEVFNVDTSGRAFEDELVMAGLPVAVSKGEGEPIAFDRPIFRGRVRYVHGGYGLGYEITRESVEDDLYGAINSQGATNLSRSMREAEEISAWTIFNNGFTTVQAFDGVSLFNAAHPGVGDLTFSNLGSTDLSVAGLKSALEGYMKMQNDRGLRMNLAPERLIVPVENWWTAQEILGATYLSNGSQGQYTPNVTQDMGLTPYKVPYLTDPDAWFLIPSKAQHTLTYLWRRKPDPESGYDGRTQISWFGITARWSVGVTRWRGLFGSPGI